MSIEGQVTFIYTRDQTASTRFYETVLELPLVLVQDGGCRLYKTGEGAFLGICREREGRVSSQDGLVVTLVRNDVEGWYRTLLDRGATVAQPPGYSKKFGVFAFFFRDPDGHLLEIQRFDDQDWHVPIT